jgi:site-specific DNA-methyltransferase (adenine-specific)
MKMSTQVDLFTTVEPTSVSPAIAKPFVSRSTFYQGDCLVESQNIADGSVDLILTDLPYGNMGMEGTDHGMTGKVSWDKTINPSDLFIVADRILRKNGKMILFSQEPYTNELIKKAIPNLPYNYKAFWEKDHFANALNAKKAMLNYAEEILIYSKNNPKHDFEGLHPLREYFLNQKSESELTDSKIKKLLGNGMGGHYFTNGSQFCLPTLKNYEKLQTTGYFRMDWNELKQIDTEYRTELLRQMNEQHPSTFNLWEGKKYKSNILKYKKDYDGYHPTQKPVLLLEDLIKTFSNENDLVVDLTMGSGSTGVACRNTNRRFIGIEKDEKYFEIAVSRVSAYCG